MSLQPETRIQGAIDEGWSTKPFESTGGMNKTGDITRLLGRLDEERGTGRAAVLEQLMPLVYSELKVLARSNRYRCRSRQMP